MKMLIEDIKNKQFKNIYLLTGEEIYLVFYFWSTYQKYAEIP